MENTIFRSIDKRTKIRKNFFENTLWKHGLSLCGIDEVGRGCLAGPLVTAAVILPSGKNYQLLRDSKTLNLNSRLLAEKWIKKHCVYGLGIVHHRIIDRYNIWNATLIAMKKALVNLFATISDYPSAILIDAMPLNIEDTNYGQIPIYPLIHGEQKSSSIAAASILAKTHRDRLMETFDKAIPGYHLAQHKGYSTKLHQEAIKTESHSIIHRTQFIRKIREKMSRSNDEKEQQSLC